MATKTTFVEYIKFSDVSETECNTCHRDATSFNVYIDTLYQYCDRCAGFAANADDLRFNSREERDVWLVKQRL